MTVTAPNRRAKYDWEKWTDGKEHAAEWGEDFTCGIPSFLALLHARARTQEDIWYVETATEGLKVTFRFHHLKEKVNSDG